MNFLEDDEIEQLDSDIDARISKFDLLKRTRDNAVLHLLVVFEELLDDVEKNLDFLFRRNHQRQAYTSLNHAVRWAYKFCKADDSQEYLVVDEEGIEEAWALIKEALVYSDIWAQMSLIQRGRTRCHLLRKFHYELLPASLEDKNRDVGRMMLSHADDPRVADEAQNITDQTRKYIENKLRVTRKGTKLSYKLSNKDFSYLRSAMSERSLLKWSMDSDWDLGGYFFKEVRLFWRALQTMQIISNIAYGSTRNDKDRIASRLKHQTSRIRMMKREDWIEEVAKYSELKREKVRLILNDLVYDEKLHQEGKPKAHVMFQPFFQFKNGEIGLCGRIVQISNIERNVWSLTALIRPKIYSDLTNLKEGFWIEEFKQKAQALGLKCASKIKFTQKGKPAGDLDLFLLDEERNIALVCELKWITPSDDPKGVELEDKEILKGIKQAENAYKWIKSNIRAFSQRTGMATDVLERAEFKSLIITKENLASGFIEKSAIPVINEKLFNWIMLEPHHKDLKTLWQIADNLNYLPKSGVHFEHDQRPTLEWGNLKFTLTNLVFTVKKHWDPRTDISLPS